MAEEQEVGVIFPLAGLETTCEFGRQPNGTTPQGVNVRGYEVITNRARGGSRSGLDQYIPQQVNGNALVQHLDVLIDPQQPALFAPSEDGPIPDPSTNNLSTRNPLAPGIRGIRRGGSGKVPNRHVGGGVTGIVQIVEGMSDGQSDAGTPPTSSITFVSSVPASRIIVVFAFCNGRDGNANALTVTTGNGTPYTKVTDSDVAFILTDTPNPGVLPILASGAAYYFETSGVAADSTVLTTADTVGEFEVIAIHTKNQNALTPISEAQTVTVSGDTGDPDLGTIDFGSLVTDRPDCIVLAGVCARIRTSLNNVTPDGSFTFVPNGFPSGSFVMSEGVTIGGAVHPTATNAPPPSLVCYGAISLFLRSE